MRLQNVQRFLVATLAITFLSSAARSAEKPVSFYKQIRPIFQANCQGCHQPAKKNGDYSMTSFKTLLKGGESGDPAIVPGKPDKSYLIELITPKNGEASMPKGKKPLSKVEVELVRAWIAQGAKNDTPANAGIRYDMQHPPAYTMAPVITSLDFSPDGKLLAVAGFHEVLLHKADGSGLVGRLVGLSERIQSIKFSPDGKRLAVTGGMPSRSGELQVWNVAKKKLELSVPVTYDTVYGASWSPDGTRIAVGCSDNTIRAFDSKTGKQLLFQGSHNDWALDTVFSVDGKHIISVSKDRTVKLTEFATQRFIDNVTSITPGALKGGIEAIDRHPTEDAVLVGGADGVPKLYRIFRQTKRVIGDDANLIRRFPQMEGRIFDVAVSRDGKRIVAVSSLNNTGQVRVYSFDFSLKASKKLSAIKKKRSVQRTEEEKRKLKSYQISGVKTVSETKLTKTGLYAAAFHPNGNMVAVAGSDGTIRLIDAGTGKISKQFVPVPLKAGGREKVAARDLGRRPEPALGDESLHENDKIVSLRVSPARIDIQNGFGNVQLVAIGTTKAGHQVDVTRVAQVTGGEGLVDITNRRRVRGLKNGTAQLTVSIHGRSARVTASVSGMDKEFHPSYMRHVAPTLARVGCNAGTCHGANKGKGGFKLSLRGGDPIFDLRAFTDDHASRRVNLASPENSLMLLKATASVPHQGGQVTRRGEPYYEVIRRWIADGAQLDLDAPQVTSIEMFPKNPIVQRIGGKQQFRIIAHYANGDVRDVTAESFITAGVTDIVAADEAGLTTALRRGESPILARYDGHYAATIMTVMGNRKGFSWAQPPANNFIDELVAAKLKRTKTLQSELCTDAEFIRRVYLDLTGLPPTAKEVNAFLADKRPTRKKRDAVIDRLIGSEAFVDYWTNKWADLLQVNRKYLGPAGSKSFREWIRKEVAANTPYDKFAYKILTAEGSNRTNPPASYYKILRNPEDTMENTTHLFLAVRFNCNKCHDHPFEKWKQDQYYETAAYFAQVGLKKDPTSGKQQIGRTAVEAGKPLYEIIYDKKSGDVKHVRTGKVTPPEFPYPVKFDPPKSKTPSRRELLARWITSKNNPYFTRSYVNRIWGYLTGVGLIEPIDDIRAGNPPTNPELLDRLTTEFLKHDFDVRHLMRVICQSRTYQLSIRTNKWNEDDTINYSHAIARRLPAEVLFDALHVATGSVSKIPGVKPGTRAAQLPDAGVKLPSGFLAKFGRPARESSCECERSSGMQLGPVMSLVSGPTVANAVTDASNDIFKLANSKLSNEKMINAIFLRILNRPATQSEITAGLETLKSIPVEHKELVAELSAYSAKLAPEIAMKEKARAKAIQTADQAVKAYERKIAPREAKLDREQQALIAKRTEALKTYEKTLPEKLKAWEAKTDRTTSWHPLDATKATATGGTKLTKQKDLSIFASGPLRRTEYRIESFTDLEGIRAIRLEALTDKRLKKNGPGRAPDGNFVVSEFEVYAAPKSDPQKKVKLKLINAQADFSQNVYNVKTAINGKTARDNDGWAVSPQTGKPHVASFQFEKPVGHKSGTILSIVIKQDFASNQHSLGRFRLSITKNDGPIMLNGPPAAIAKILDIKADKRNKAQSDQLLKYFRSIDARLKKLQTELAASKRPRPVDPELVRLRSVLVEKQKPLPIDPKLADLRRAVPMLPFVMMPRPLQESNVVGKAGTAGFLGRAYDPYYLYPPGGDLDMNKMDRIAIDDLKLRPHVYAKRLKRRARLRDAINQGMPEIDKAVSQYKLGSYYQRALDLVVSGRARDAFQLDRESNETRERYGKNTFGQSLLLARRLVEAGTRVVEVVWPKVANSDNHSWDVHTGLTKRMKTQSAPMLDAGLSALVSDLDERGMLDETLIVAVGEFGRSPQRGVSTSGNNNSSDGRDHWPYCYTSFIAGAGIKRGVVHGQSDKTGSGPRKDPVHPGQLLATIYHAFGIKSDTLVYNHLNQPRELVKAEPVTSLFG
eukprot:g10237.t1